MLAPKKPRERVVNNNKTDDNDNAPRRSMGRREAAEKGLWKLRAFEAKWALFVPLHRLWCGYMVELLGPTGTVSVAGTGMVTVAQAAAAGMHAKLVKADFHGSIVTGTCVCFVFVADGR